MRLRALAVTGLAACAAEAARPEKVYVCDQEVGRLDVLDGRSLDRLALIDPGAGRAPHNVEVTPRGDRVLVTSPDGAGAAPDELLVLDPTGDTIAARVALDPGAVVAHVVATPDGARAFVSGWRSGRVYQVDLVGLARLGDVVLPAGRAPHGLRLDAGGERLYAAASDGYVVEIHAGAGAVLREFELPGQAVQVAVGEAAVYATVFTPPAVARIERASGEVTVWDLPGARGPAQLALLPDERSLVVADQGVDTAPGNRVYVLDTATGAVTAEIEVGLGAHGVALSADGRLAYVTGLFDASVAIVDLSAAHTETLGRTERGPTGVAVWR